MLPAPGSDGSSYWTRVMDVPLTARPPERSLGPSCSIDPELARDPERLGALVAGTDTDVATMGGTDYFPPGFFLDELLGQLSVTERPPGPTLAPEGFYAGLSEAED